MQLTDLLTLCWLNWDYQAKTTIKSGKKPTSVTCKYYPFDFQLNSVFKKEVTEVKFGDVTLSELERANDVLQNINMTLIYTCQMFITM